MIEVIKVYGVSVSDFLKYAAAFVFKSEIAADEYGNVLETLAKYDYRILAGANPEYNFLQSSLFSFYFFTLCYVL